MLKNINASGYSEKFILKVRRNIENRTPGQAGKIYNEDYLYKRTRCNNCKEMTDVFKSISTSKKSFAKATSKNKKQE